MKRPSPKSCARCDDAGCDWCVLPASLAEEKNKRRPCSMCGKRTVGTMGRTAIRLMPDGSIGPKPAVLCNDCDPHGSRARDKARFERERREESYRSGRHW